MAFPVLAAALLGARRGPQARRAGLRARERRRDPVAAPVLVLRASRGLHHRAAVLRHRHRDPAGVQPQADLRLQGPGLRDDLASPACRSPCGRTTCTSTGQVALPFFAFMTMLIAVPTGVKFFNWIGTMWRGSLTFETPMLWSLGFLVTFLFGGLTGIILSTPALDFHLSDTYFVVAHFHYVIFGTVVFAMFAGFYFWWPKLTGQMLDERLGQGPLLADVHRLPHDVPHPALARRRGHAAPLRRLPARGRLHSPEPGVHRRCVDPRVSFLPFLCNVYTHLEARAPGHRRTTRGATAARWSGRRPARRRGTTSPRCRASVPSAPRSTCTTRRSRPPQRPRRTRRCSPVRTAAPTLKND